MKKNINSSFCERQLTDSNNESNHDSFSHTTTNNNNKNNSNSSYSGGETGLSGGLFGGMEITRIRQNRRSVGSTAGSQTTCVESSTSVPLKGRKMTISKFTDEETIMMNAKVQSAGVREDVEGAPQSTQIFWRHSQCFLEQPPEMLPQLERLTKERVTCEEKHLISLLSNCGSESKQQQQGEVSFAAGGGSFSYEETRKVASAFDFISNDPHKQTQGKTEDSGLGKVLSKLNFSSSFAQDKSFQLDRQYLTGATKKLVEQEKNVTPCGFLSQTAGMLSVVAGTESCKAPQGTFSCTVLSSTPTEEELEATADFDTAEAEPMKLVEVEDKDKLPCEHNYTEFKNKEYSELCANPGVFTKKTKKTVNTNTSTTTEKGSNSNDCKKEYCVKKMSESVFDDSCFSSINSAMIESETLWERQERELQNSQANMLAARAALAHVINEIHQSILQRRDSIKKIGELEAKIGHCVAEEMFEEAENLSTEVQQLGKYVAELDMVPVKLLHSQSERRDQLLSVIQNHSCLLLRHRQELLDSREDEERRVRKFIQDTGTGIDIRKKKLAVLLEQAGCVEKNAKNEKIELCERKERLNEKMLKQCQELSASQLQLSREKADVDTEIAMLETKLAALRLLSSKKATDLHEITTKLECLTAEHELFENKINSFIIKEENRMREAADNIEQLHRERDALLSEEQNFDARKELMLAELENSDTKIEDHVRRSVLLESQTLAAVRAFSDVLVEPLRLRLSGRGLLFPAAPLPAVVPDGTAPAEDSPLFCLHDLQRRLSALDASDAECRATVASIAVRLAEMRDRLVLLETAKKSAAQAKQFREAQLMSDEIHSLTSHVAELTAASCAAEKALCSNMSERLLLQNRLCAEKAAAMEQVQEFFSRYSDVLNVAEASVVAPDALQFLTEGTDSDDLVEAMQCLMATLRNELEEVPHHRNEDALMNENGFCVTNKNFEQHTPEESFEKCLFLKDNTNEIDDAREGDKLPSLVDSFGSEPLLDMNATVDL